MYGVGSNVNVCQFIDECITCAIPEDEVKLKDLVCYSYSLNIQFIASVTNVAVLIFPVLAKN